jgi:hypothetical protein
MDQDRAHDGHADDGARLNAQNDVGDVPREMDREEE